MLSKKYKTLGIKPTAKINILHVNNKKSCLFQKISKFASVTLKSPQLAQSYWKHVKENYKMQQ